MKYTEEILKKVKVTSKADLTRLATESGIAIPSGTRTADIVKLILNAEIPVSEEHVALLNVKPDEIAANTPKFTKEQILLTHWYSHQREILTDRLKKGELYTYAQIEDMLSK